MRPYRVPCSRRSALTVPAPLRLCSGPSGDARSAPAPPPAGDGHRDHPPGPAGAAGGAGPGGEDRGTKRPMLTQREAATACGVSRSTIRRRREAGDLPGAVSDETRGWLMPPWRLPVSVGPPLGTPDDARWRRWAWEAARARGGWLAYGLVTERPPRATCHAARSSPHARTAQGASAEAVKRTSTAGALLLVEDPGTP